jgi:SAM-dependent methyltransferase
MSDRATDRPVYVFQQEYYDRLKAIHDRHWWVSGMTDMMDHILKKRLSVSDVRVLLDIGCGSGAGLIWAARRFPDATRLGTDLSKYAVAHCLKLGAEVSVASGDKLPYRDSSVDLVLCTDVMQHVPDDAGLLGEAFRVLRPDGWLYVRTNARTFVPAPLGSRLFTGRMLRSALVGAGFRVLRCSRANVMGSLFAEVSQLINYVLSRNSRGIWCGTCPTVPSAGHGSSFRGGGYGNGLHLTPEPHASIASRLKRRLLAIEAQLIDSGVRLAFGHSLIALARKAHAEGLTR